MTTASSTGALSNITSAGALLPGLWSKSVTAKYTSTVWSGGSVGQAGLVRFHPNVTSVHSECSMELDDVLLSIALRNGSKVFVHLSAFADPDVYPKLILVFATVAPDMCVRYVENRFVYTELTAYTYTTATFSGNTSTTVDGSIATYPRNF